MEIFTATDSDRLKWDEYVMKSDHATFYHQWGWKRVVENSLGHNACYLMAKTNNTINGILPLFLVKTPFLGRFLVSAPAANYGGICADNHETAVLLLNRAKDLVEGLRASYLELRDFWPNEYKLPQVSSYVTVLINLDHDPYRVWRNFRGSVRNSARKAAKAGLKIEMSMDRLPMFYELYSINMHRIGSPCFGPDFFKSILDEFPETARIVWARTGARMVAADLIAFFKDNVISLYAGTDHGYLRAGVNSLLTWEEIKYGCEKGFAYYDFGRCEHGSGTFNFKKRWNGEIHPLYYQYYLRTKGAPPSKSPRAPGFRLSSMVWRRLPLCFTRRLGPHIVKYLH